MSIAADANGNTAMFNYVANTDNVFFSEKMRTLFIGEDSGMHVNNYVWAYNVDTQKLTRILKYAAGGEFTGLQAVEEHERLRLPHEQQPAPGRLDLEPERRPHPRGSRPRRPNCSARTGTAP